jgi:anti-sigma regulatory factor (Ser/Thr protein kinase)
MSNRFIQQTVLVSSSSKVEGLVKSNFYDGELFTTVTTVDEYETVSIEAPNLVIIDFTNWELGFDVLDMIISDPWLNHQAVITITNSHDDHHHFNANSRVNLIGSVSVHDIEDELAKLLSVIRHNSQLLFKRTDVGQISRGVIGEFKIANSITEIECIVNLLCSYLYNSNRVDWSGKNRLRTALTEILVNGVEHGNCHIGFDEKQKWLSEHNFIEDLIEKRKQSNDVLGKWVTLSYDINLKDSYFRIEDEGDGFNWRQFMAPSKKDIDRYAGVSGRGIIMALSSLASLTFNDKGNEVTASIDHQVLVSNEAPAILMNFPQIETEPGEIVMNQNDKDCAIFFILSGNFEVQIDSIHITTLTPNDIFIGEMSFLLGGRRSATVRSATEGKLIKIEKIEFLKILKEHSNYSIFLARLLSERLDHLNQILKEYKKENSSEHIDTL